MSKVERVWSPEEVAEFTFTAFRGMYPEETVELIVLASVRGQCGVSIGLDWVKDFIEGRGK